MKLLLLTTPIFATNFESYRGQRAVDTIQCPGRCWEFDGTMCVPEADKVTLDCSTIGEVEFTANSCLFTPDGADYTGQEIFVTTASDFSNADCKKKITSSNETLVFSWSYQAAQTCGWTWSQDGNDLKFENSLKVSGNSNKITTGGVTLTIADNADDIPLSCSFGNSFTIQSDVVDSEESTKNQNASTSATGDISSAFSMELKNSADSVATSFIIGEQMKSVVTFDYASAGYTQATDSPIAFYPQTCNVKNGADGAPGTDLVSLVSDRCLRDDSILDINTSSNLPAEKFLRDAYSLSFDAFSFQSSTKLEIECTFKVCLAADCPGAVKTC